MIVFATATDGTPASARKRISAPPEKDRIQCRRAFLLGVGTRSASASYIATPPICARGTSRSSRCQGSGYPEGTHHRQFAVRTDRHRLGIVDQVDEPAVPHHLGAQMTSRRLHTVRSQRGGDHAAFIFAGTDPAVGTRLP